MSLPPLCSQLHCCLLWRVGLDKKRAPAVGLRGETKTRLHICMTTTKKSNCSTSLAVPELERSRFGARWPHILSSMAVIKDKEPSSNSEPVQVKFWELTKREHCTAVLSLRTRTSFSCFWLIPAVRLSHDDEQRDGPLLSRRVEVGGESTREQLSAFHSFRYQAHLRQRATASAAVLDLE